MHLRSLSLKLVVTRFVCNGAYVVGYGCVHSKITGRSDTVSRLFGVSVVLDGHDNLYLWTVSIS